MTYRTSSTAGAERPRDALCPSVLSLKKIMTRAESFSIVSRLDVWQAVITGPVVVSLPSSGRDSAYASVIT